LSSFSLKTQKQKHTNCQKSTIKDIIFLEKSSKHSILLGQVDGGAGGAKAPSFPPCGRP